MSQNNIEILSTKEIEKALVDTAAENNMVIECSPFIKTEIIKNSEVQQEIEQALLQSISVVFTSVNAVEAVADELQDQQPTWNIYCIGYATKNAIEKYFGEDLLAGIADNAAELAELIVEESEGDEVYFFCGDQHRDELPGILRKNGIDVNEIIVYETILIPHKLDKKYDGILFFSPSAVKSFFKKNKVSEYTVLFAIGETTAGELRNFSKNKIVISDEPVKKSLVEKAISFYQQTQYHTNHKNEST
jgi:uroporphyrinogen-III synthase